MAASFPSSPLTGNSNASFETLFSRQKASLPNKDAVKRAFKAVVITFMTLAVLIGGAYVMSLPGGGAKLIGALAVGAGASFGYVALRALYPPISSHQKED